MPRPRLTIGRLMLGVAGAAVCLAFSRIPLILLMLCGGLAAWVGCHLAVGFMVWRACWFCSVRPRSTFKVLVATSLLLITWMSFLGIIWVYAGYNAEHLLLGVTVWLPLIVGTVIWSRDDRDRRSDRRVARERVALWTLVGMASCCVLGNLPFHLAFAVSRPALDRIADEVASGTQAGDYRPVRAGLFWVVRRLDPDTKQLVDLAVEDHGGSLLAFFESPHFCRTTVPLDRTSGGLAYREGDVPLGGGWYYKYWGQLAD